MKYICEFCGKSNNKSGRNHHFCNHKCYANSLKGKSSNIKGKKGLWGNNKTSFKKGQLPWNKGIGLKNKIQYCKNCGKEFKSDKKTTKFCSKGCASSYRQLGVPKTLKSRIKMSIAKTKEKEFNGFRSYFNRRIRRLYEYQQWRLMVLGRDNFTCQDCGKRGSYLETHHKIRLAQLIITYNIHTLKDAKCCKELWSINNGITLCIKCHDKKDKHRKIKRDNSRED